MHYDDEHEDGRRLLAPLVGEPTFPCTVDIQRAVADGRRRLRTRRWAGVGAVAAVTALAVAGVPAVLDLAGGPAGLPPPSAAAPAELTPPGLTTCQVERLPVPGDAYQSVVTGGDPTGRFLLGRSYTPTGTDRGNLIPGTSVQVLIWDDGEPVLVDLAGFDPSLHDINSRGEAVGTSYRSGTAVSWVYREGEVTQLADGHQAYAINERGEIVGSRAGADERHTGPVVWRSPHAAPEDLPVPGKTWTVVATDVDADGTVVGHGRDRRGAVVDRRGMPDAPTVSFVWAPDGSRQRLPVPTSQFGTVTGFAADRIRDGIVVGRAEQDLGDGVTAFPVFQYDLATGTFTELTGTNGTGAYEWNAAGWLAAGSGDGLALWHADAGPIPLPGLPDVSDPAGPLDTDVTSISDDGRLVGGQLPSGRMADDDIDPYALVDAVVWHCR